MHPASTSRRVAPAACLVLAALSGGAALSGCAGDAPPPPRTTQPTTTTTTTEPPVQGARAITDGVRMSSWRLSPDLRLARMLVEGAGTATFLLEAPGVRVLVGLEWPVRPGSRPSVTAVLATIADQVRPARADLRYDADGLRGTITIDQRVLDVAIPAGGLTDRSDVASVVHGLPVEIVEGAR
jgi:hypothetical protein